MSPMQQEKRPFMQSAAIFPAPMSELRTKLVFAAMSTNVPLAGGANDSVAKESNGTTAQPRVGNERPYPKKPNGPRNLQVNGSRRLVWNARSALVCNQSGAGSVGQSGPCEQIRGRMPHPVSLSRLATSSKGLCRPC